jgi:hypothetical protein
VNGGNWVLITLATGEMSVIRQCLGRQSVKSVTVSKCRKLGASEGASRGQ